MEEVLIEVLALLNKVEVHGFDNVQAMGRAMALVHAMAVEVKKVATENEQRKDS